MEASLLAQWGAMACRGDSMDRLAQMKRNLPRADALQPLLYDDGREWWRAFFATDYTPISDFEAVWFGVIIL